MLHQLAAGLATGAIYGLLALALVLNFKACGHLNFAQGEMAMFSTFVAWTLLRAGLPYWAAMLVTVVVALATGALIERWMLRPLDRAAHLKQVVVLIALFIGLNALAGAWWGFVPTAFPSPAQTGAQGEGLIGGHHAFVALISATVLTLLTLFFRWTDTGLVMRAAALNPESARLMGLRVSRLSALGWGLAAALGAVAGMLVAPITFLEPNMMVGLLLYALAAALLGGIDSAPGAVIGGLIVGVLENLLGAFVVGPQLKFSVALGVVVLVLILRPQGLLGRKTARRY